MKTKTPKRRLLTRRVSRRCDNCKFFYEGEDGPECRRHPPQIHMHNAADEDRPPCDFPAVLPEDWCGEFKAANAEVSEGGTLTDGKH